MEQPESYIQILNAFVTKCGPIECREWFCYEAPAQHAWDDAIHSDGITVVRLHTELSSYIEAYISIHWTLSKAHFTRQDTKAGVFDASWDVAITNAQLSEFKKVLWPAPQKDFGPWF